ncbi:MAG: hypothetical protein V1908_03590 [Candidatus Peregrinibacteria bacterium]
MQKTFYPISEARKHLGALIQQVKHSREILALGHHNKVEAYLVPIDYLSVEESDTQSKSLTMEDVSDFWTYIHEAFDIFNDNMIFYRGDRNPSSAYRWAAQWKAHEILRAILKINHALIKGNFDLQKLKILSAEKARWLTQVPTHEEMPVKDMNVLLEWTPLYLKALSDFLRSLAR